MPPADAPAELPVGMAPPCPDELAPPLDVPPDAPAAPRLPPADAPLLLHCARPHRLSHGETRCRVGARNLENQAGLHVREAEVALPDRGGGPLLSGRSVGGALLRPIGIQGGERALADLAPDHV